MGGDEEDYDFRRSKIIKYEYGYSLERGDSSDYNGGLGPKRSHL